MLSEDVSTLWRSQPNFTFGGHVPDEGRRRQIGKGGSSPSGIVGERSEGKALYRAYSPKSRRAHELF